MDIKEKHQLLLSQLVGMFQMTALEQMGKLKSPITGNIELDLPQAQLSIDMLDMLSVKMKGNLTPEEEKMFTSVLKDLRLNYVDEIGKQQKQDHQPPQSEESSPSAS